MQGSDIVAYTARFCDLVALCPNMVPTESKKIERYIWGLVPLYRGNVLASHPATFDSAKELAQRLIDQEVPSTPSTTTTTTPAPTNATDNKRKRGDRRKGKSNQSSSKNQQMVAVHAATTPAIPVPAKTYAGSLPKCTKCSFHHNGPCREMHCTNCDRKGQPPGFAEHLPNLSPRSLVPE
ncbi:unnamed protein product [Lactuca virosa]|uniref:Reverse transcriptase domain-containing protein n=1 Tax=Lactuca virosa TaxID=75947 RepID=A0AAU9NHG7_9ASTR|nr:unnamed protein product [Lactuca virosa]